MKIALYALVVLVIVQAVTYFIFVKNEDKKWSKLLRKFFRILIAGIVASFWVWMSVSNDPDINVLVKIVGACAGLFVIYLVFKKLNEEELKTK